MTTSPPDFVPRLRDTTIAVAGAGGYLGSALLRALRGLPCHVVALTARGLEPGLAESGWRPRTLTVLECDLVRADAWTEPLRQWRPDIVFHLAAFEHRHGSPHAPQTDLAVNAGSVLHLLESCRELRLAPRIVFTSSANLAGCPTRLPVTEAFPDQPMTLFAIHKLTAERYLQHYARSSGIGSIVLRLANVYGMLGEGSLEIAARVVLNRMVQKALTGGPLLLFRNQDCRRDFVHVSDVVQALCAAALLPAPGDGSPYIIGSEEGHPLREIVRLVADRAGALLGRPPVVQLQEDVPLEAVEWREFIADCGRMRQATGWFPGVGLHQGVDRTMRQFHDAMARA